MATKLIFLHGGPGYPDYLGEFFAGGFCEDFECVFYSQTTTGRVDDMLKELEGKVSEGCYLIGHSWGGALATEYLQRTRDPRVRGLILLSSFVCIGDITTEFQNELKARNLETATPKQIYLGPEEQEVGDELITRLQKTFNLPVFNALRESFLATFDARDFIRAGVYPILSIFGSEDLRVPARCQREQAGLSPKVRCVEIKGAGHFPFLLTRSREAVIAAIEAFTA